MSIYNVKTTKGEKSTVIIEGEIPADVFESYRGECINHLNDRVEIPGFRKGKAPEAVLFQHVPEMALLEEMADHALRENYGKIIAEEKIDAIGSPEVTITKIAVGNALGFKITTAVMPDISLPDYTKIAKEVSKKVEVVIEEKDIEDTIQALRKERALTIKGDGAKMEDITDADLPELNDGFAQSFGMFENLVELRSKIAENMRLEKEQREKEKNRLTIIEKILEGTKVEIPQILIDAELDKMLFRMKSDIEQMGLSFEDYLTHLKKTEADLRTEFTADATKRVTIELVIHAIGTKEKITPDAEKVEKEIGAVLERYKDADPQRARVYVESLLASDAVFAFLESQGK